MRSAFNPTTLLAAFLSVIALGIVTTFSGCDKEVFKPDTFDPRLPRYTNKGNQVGGTLINNVAWKTDFECGLNGCSNTFSIKNDGPGDSVVVELSGYLTESLDSGAHIDIYFVLRDLELLSLADVRQLQGVRFVLDGTNNYGMIDDWSQILTPGVSVHRGGVGELSVKSVKEITHVTIGGSGSNPYHPLIVSGTFQFSIPHPPKRVDVRKGRFDFKFYREHLILLQ